MPTITVTQELANSIQIFRKDAKIRGDALSKDLKKNTSFISQLENGKIQEIDLSLFHELFRILIPDEQIRTTTINDLIKNLSVKLSVDEIKKQNWMFTMDYQYRLQKIPNDIIQFLTEKLEYFESKSILSSDIVRKMNTNDELDDEELLNLKDNEVYVQFNEYGDLGYSIKFNLDLNFIDNIISKTKTKTNYINMLGIIYTMFKMEGFNGEESLKRSKEILGNAKFYTLLEKQKILKNENYRELLNDDDRRFTDLFDVLHGHLKFFSDTNAGYVNKKLDIMCSNLTKEPALTLAVMGISLTELSDLDSSRKKEFLKELQVLVSKYTEFIGNNDIQLLD